MAGIKNDQYLVFDDMPDLFNNQEENSNHSFAFEYNDGNTNMANNDMANHKTTKHLLKLHADKVMEERIETKH